MIRITLLTLVATCLSAQEPVRLVQDFALSPDGQTLVFARRGDIWTVPALGGAAQRLTRHPGSDARPRYSPDGKQLAFISSRPGSPQLFTMPAAGGPPQRITHHTSGYSLEEWLPDGSAFLTRASRDHYWRDGSRFFVQPKDGSVAPELLFDGYGNNGRLSPDGRHLLFTRESTGTWRKDYHGAQASQVWLYDREQGSFRLLHNDEAGTRWPLWGKRSGVYYTVSQRDGTWNLYRHLLDGDAASRQLTTFTDDGVMFPAISRDGSTLVFSRLFDLHRLDLASGRIHPLEIHIDGDSVEEALRRETISRATAAAFTDDAREIALVAGGDLWVMDTELKEPVRITETPEEERSPLFTPDHKKLIFVSDAGGQSDIWMATPADPERFWWQNEAFELKKLTDDALVEQNLRLWDGGKKLAYIRGGGDLVSMALDGSDTEVLIASWNPPSYDFSPDGKWLVYSVQDDDYNHDVWIKALDGSREPFNLSCHPDNDTGPKWSPDGGTIAFTGRRWGDESDVVYVYLDRKKHEETGRQRQLEKALAKMKGRKKKAPPKKTPPKPEVPAEPADLVSGQWEGRIKGPPPIPSEGFDFTMDITLGKDGTLTGEILTPLGEGEIERGTFDPKTGKLSITMLFDGEEVTIEGTVENGKASGTWNSSLGADGTWTASRDVEDAPPPTPKKEGEQEEKKKPTAKKPKEKKPKVVKIDFEGIRDRLRRIRVPNSGEGQLLWSHDGKKLTFRASLAGKRGIYAVQFPDKLTPKLMASSRPSPGRWLKEGNQIVGLSGGKPTGLSASGKATSYSFQVRVETDLAARSRALFDQAWRTMRDRFYDENLGNNDWDAIRAKYGAMADACIDPGDLGTVINMMLGELNGSHLGFMGMGMGRGRIRSTPRAGNQWSATTGHLGVRFDPAHPGPGLKIKDVIRESPAARADSRLEPGEIILEIDGQAADPKVEIATLLTGEPNRDVILKVKGSDDAEREVTIRPTSYGSVRRQLYQEWVEANRKKVEELSEGRLGYVHIASMGSGNLVQFDAELYRIGYGKDGLVIDVRENGGGSITDHLLTCLCQPTHAITRARGGGPGYPHDRRIYATWSKPIVVLCNQNSFSNAEIFSHAVKTLKRGRVVGVPTAGGVISTGGASLMGMGMVRLPFRGWYLLDGEDMELNGCRPDFVIWPEPGEVPAGTDRQLEKAVEVLEEDVDAWKARPRPPLRKATERR